ncbi:sciellin isoform X2 [Sinocyclocheilus anshuiensis]|uniref:sciellin isoform X2 n=1 Tax=Sinocyclocheilus anshuiensis TaxID=1608454 RepID=UPI0007B80052|nr:PREDICTED: sciellin-like isoform X2 [Sinocyclocheilus anshuiensis]
MSTQTKSDSGKKRAVLKDNSWIRRNPEEDELVDYDPNPGKVVLGQRKSGNDVDSKPLEDDQTSVNSGTSVSSLTKRFGGSQEMLNKSSTNTKSGAVSISSPSKPPLPVKNPALKTPNSSSFTARVFSGANTSSKPSSPVKRAFGEKLPEVTASQNTDGIAKSSSDGAAPSTPPSSVTVSSSAAPAAMSTGVKSPVIQPAVKSPSRSESVSVSSLVSTSSTPSAQTVITNTKTSSSMLEETPKPAEKPSVDLKLSDISYSSARSPSSPPAVTLNTRYSYQTPSAPLDDLADTLLPTRSGSVQPQPVRSQTQVTTVYSEIPAASPTLRSPLQTLESSRTVSSRDVCTVCGKPIAGSERMILEDLKIISHASCFRCAVCRCDLGGLEAGKSLWVYRERVNCANCFSKIRGQWYI